MDGCGCLDMMSGQLGAFNQGLSWHLPGQVIEISFKYDICPRELGNDDDDGRGCRLLLTSSISTAAHLLVVESSYSL